MGIDTAMLAAMQSAIGELLPDTANICSVTNTADGQGGWTVTRGTVGTAIKCRLDVIQNRGLISGGEQKTGGALQAYTSYMLSVPYSTTVLPSYIIEHSSVDYSVKSINRNQSWKAVVRVELGRL